MGIVQELKKEFEIREEWIGFEIHPETPVEGVDLRKRFGEANLKGMLNNITNMCKEYGLEIGEIDHMPNTRKVILVAEYAKEQGKFDAFHHKVMEEYFRFKADIGKDDIIKDIGEAVGLDRDKIQRVIDQELYLSKISQDVEDAKLFNITSTPTFIINDKYKIAGAQSIDKFRDIFEKLK